MVVFQKNLPTLKNSPKGTVYNKARTVLNHFQYNLNPKIFAQTRKQIEEAANMHSRHCHSISLDKQQQG